MTGSATTMRIEAGATAISWIPSEAVRGLSRLPFDRGTVHYDEPPPSRLEGPEHLDRLRSADRFRFANVIRAWIDVDSEGRIRGFGQDGGGAVGATTVALAGRRATFDAVAYPDLVPEPEVGETWVRFRQTAGGRTGVPAPRRVNRPPFVQVAAPTAWSTVELTIDTDGRSRCRLTGASPFPRHWLYDTTGALVAKSGTIEFRRWYRRAFGAATPWGDLDLPVASGEIESDLERALSHEVMGRGRSTRRFKAGRELLRQGDHGDHVYLLLDGVVAVSVDGEVVAELGPGAVLGERATVDGGGRTATVVALTPCTVAHASADVLAPTALRALAAEHQREHGAGSPGAGSSPASRNATYRATV